MENAITKKIPILNTINCTENNTEANPFFQTYPVKETPSHFTTIELQLTQK
jgi:hypothetical protein